MPTLGQLASQNFRCILVAEAHGLDFHKDAGKPLADLCPPAQLAALEAAFAKAAAPRVPPATDWNAVPLRALIRHLIERHHEYLKLELPRLRARLDRMQSRHGERDGNLLNRLHPVYCALQAELELHLHKEEMILFPFIERYDDAATLGHPAPPPPFGTIRNPIGVMEHEHDSALNALKEMRAITRDYQPADYACANFRAVFHSLEELEADLLEHIRLENGFLHTRAAALEAQLFG